MKSPPRGCRRRFSTLEMPKRKTVASLKKKLWPIFSQYIRLRDCLETTGSPEYGECITCEGGPFAFKDIQAGHFIPGRHNSNLFSERGTHGQCRACNILYYGRPLEYRRQIVKMYGEGADEELESEARQIKKFTVSELEEMIIHYQDKIEKLLGGLT